MPTAARGTRILLVLAIVLLALAALPYALPMPNQDGVMPERPFAESRFVDAGGARLHLRDWPANGPRRGCDVLLVHGILGSTATWDPLAPMLARTGRRVVAIDLPGAGYSTRDRVAGEAVAAHAWQAIDAVGGTTRPWCLIGHGTGARVIASMLAAGPDRVAGMAYVDGSPLHAALAGDVPASQRFLRATPPGRRFLSWQVARDTFTPAGVAARLRDDYGREPRADEIEVILAPLRLPGTASALVDTLRDLATADSAAVDPAVLGAKPTLVVWGRDDARSPAAIGGELALAIPGAQGAVIERAGHRPMASQPEATARVIVRWLDGLLTRAN